MLGEVPFASRRNLFGLWNQILPELTIGLFSILTFFSSWKSAWTWGAAARLSRIRPSKAFRSAGEKRSVGNRGGAEKSAKVSSGNSCSGGCWVVFLNPEAVRGCPGRPQYHTELVLKNFQFV